MSDYEKKILEMEEEENAIDDDILELVGDDGEAVNFFHLATLEHKKEWYIVLQPTEETEDISEDELIIMQLATDEEDNDVFLPIDDEKILNAVYEEYVKLAEEIEAEGDDEDEEVTAE